MPLGSDYDGQDCALARALEVVGERWTLLVLRDCLFGVRRFSDLLAHLDISRAVLAARLADLVDAGLLERHEYRPGRHDYRVTRGGRGAVACRARADVLGRAAPLGRRAQAALRARRLRHRDRPVGHVPPLRHPPRPGDLEIRPGPALRHRRDDPVSRALREPHRMLTPLPG